MSHPDSGADAIAHLRKDYRAGELLEHEVLADPIEQFRQWFADARTRLNPAEHEVNAMTLATVNSAGQPHARIVLLKEFDQQGFSFFTNYQSAKGQDLAANAHAALVFYWPPLERQVRVEGVVVRLTEAESDDYYAIRPLGSRLGAWASPQSQVISSPAELQANMTHYQTELGDQPPRPAHWGGYRLAPNLLEFWQGRSSRLHDRLQYVRSIEQSGWKMQRLAP